MATTVGPPWSYVLGGLVALALIGTGVALWRYGDKKDAFWTRFFGRSVFRDPQTARERNMIAAVFFVALGVAILAVGVADAARG
jgi:hypothetical protein